MDTNTETKGNGGDAGVKSSPLLSESMISLGIACKLLDECRIVLSTHPLAKDIEKFQERLLKGPMYTTQVNDLLR